MVEGIWDVYGGRLEEESFKSLPALLAHLLILHRLDARATATELEQHHQGLHRRSHAIQQLTRDGSIRDDGEARSGGQGEEPIAIGTRRQRPSLQDPRWSVQDPRHSAEQLAFPFYSQPAGARGEAT